MTDDSKFTKTTTMPGTERKCPNCGGTLTYNAKARQMYCSLCGKFKEISYGTHKDLEVKGIPYNAIFNSNCAIPGDKCKILSCDNCGAELIYDSLQVSGTCPFCGFFDLWIGITPRSSQSNSILNSKSPCRFRFGRSGPEHELQISQALPCSAFRLSAPCRVSSPRPGCPA